ncbi:MAG: GntR family transcriptional regulator, partial [Spirochaetota bacterium]
LFYASHNQEWAVKGLKFQKRRGMPLYIQIQEHLLQKIEEGIWPEESMIPTEADLCREYNVSNITVREAIKLLVKDGKLSRTPGKGTFVTRHKLEQKLNRFFSFTRWALQNGLKPASRILRVETMDCDGHIARHLDISENAPVTRIERLRLGDNEPLMLEVIWIPAQLCPDLHLKDLSNIPLNDIINNEYGIPLIKAVESIEPRMPDENIAYLLGIDKNVLLLYVEHTAYTSNNKIVYFVTSAYRGDRVKFTVELTSS